MIGILGGMGVAASIQFEQRLHSLASSLYQRDLTTLHLADPSIPARADHLCGVGPSPLPSLVQNLQLLESTDQCKFCVMPCITAHTYIDSLQASSSLKVLSALDSKILRALIERPVLVLGNRPTMFGVNGRQSVLTLSLDAMQIAWRVPEDELTKAVHKYIVSIKRGALRQDSALLDSIGEGLRSDEAVVLACSELSLLKAESIDSPVFFDLIEMYAEFAIHSYFAIT